MPGPSAQAVVTDPSQTSTDPTEADRKHDVDLERQRTAGDLSPAAETAPMPAFPQIG
jgi:hypothetical protein